MDDCNENVQAEIKYRIASSDSSMDDCNPETTYEVEEIYTVQIPLWTIVTLKPAAQKPATPGFRFLYGRL